MRVRAVLRDLVMLCTVLALAVSVGAPAAAQAAGNGAATGGSAYKRLNPKPNLHIMPTHSAAKASKPITATAPAGVSLTYRNGPVMQAGTKTIPIFWQPANLQDGSLSAPDPGYNTLLIRFLSDIGGHGLYNNLTQYYQVVSGHTQYIVNSSGFLQAVVDTSPYPASTGDCVANAVVNCITDLQLQAEIANVITSGSLPTNYSTAYMVFTDPMEASCASPTQCFNPENYNNFAYCAYHGEFLLGGQPVIYANMPYVDSEIISNLLCAASLNVNGGANQSFDDETSPASHEFMEMLTDPNADASGWYDDVNGEIGDICVGDAVPVTWGANSYIVQTEYSNAVANCIPGGDNALSLSSSSGAAGSSTTVTGTGFTANHAVTLSFSDGSGTVTALGSTTSNGSGAISKSVTIPGGASNGLGTVDATGADPGDGASAGFTVSGGPTTWALTVSKSGTGTGGVTSSPVGVNCGATCQFSFNDGDSVTLTATAGTGSSFTGWSGSGCSGTGTCNVSMTQARGVTATFTLNTYSLTVSNSGTGTGGVTSSPAGINCGATCQFDFNYNTSVTLTATAGTGSSFTGWSGSGCSGTGTCNVSMTQARGVTATFSLNTYTLTASKSGNGTGNISSQPLGVDCGATCQFGFSYNTSVTLTATAGTGSSFTGWSGSGCSGTGTCNVSMTQARGVTATFSLNTYTLTVSKTGTGTGGVTSSPAGINCGATCQFDFNYNTSVTLTATAGTGSSFTGWSGSGCSGTGTCNVSITQAGGVTANFSLNTYMLSVAKTGTGTGNISSQPLGVDCGATCQFGFDYNTSVTLTATPDTGFYFTGWSGSGCSGTGTCNVSMTQARSVIANFAIAFRPDGLLSYKTGAAVGNDVYNTTGASQVRAVTIARGSTAVFHWTVQNDGALTDRILFSAPAGTAAFKVTFLSGTANVTAAVVAGTYGRSLAPGASFSLTVRIAVTTKAAVGAVRGEALTATSNNSPVSDVVLARVTAK